MTEIKKPRKKIVSDSEPEISKKIPSSKKKIETKEELVDEKKLLKEAEDREKEAKIAIKKEKKIKKEEKVVEKKIEEKSIEIHRAKKRSKKYRQCKEKIEVDKIYEIEEAIKLICQLPKPSFDPTIELHIRIDKKIENLRGVVNLPAGAPKAKKVLEVGDKNIDEVIAKIKAGKIDFDVMVATPSAMPKLAVLAKILGPKGLMPNPKNGTITENTQEAAEDFKGGKVEFKADKGNNLHFAIAKVSFGEQKIKENIDSAFSAVPIGKVVSAHLNPTMGPSIRIKISK